VLAASGSQGDDVFAARCAMARALLTHMAVLGEGKLALSAPDALPATARHELLDLAGTLISQLAGSPLSVAVRFDGAAFEADAEPEENVAFAVA
jgi:hypothetical protein